MAAISGCKKERDQEKVEQEQQIGEARNDQAELNQLRDEACGCAGDPTCLATKKTKFDEVAERSTLDEDVIASIRATIETCETNDDVSDYVAEFLQWKNEACACKEPTCIATGYERMKALNERRKTYGAPNPEADEAAEYYLTQGGGCLHRTARVIAKNNAPSSSSQSSASSTVGSVGKVPSSAPPVDPKAPPLPDRLKERYQ